MNVSLKDIPALGRPLLVLGVIIALCAGGIVYSSSLVKDAKRQLSAAQTALAEARQRVQRSGEEMQTLKTYTGPYQQLEQQGVIGDEQRLNWVDALRVANVDAQLYGVDYEVGAQTSYSFATEVGAGSLPLQQSIMKLRFGLLQEPDLFTFFDVLAGQKVGLFSVNQCSLQRLVTDVSRPTNQPTLRAECDVTWVTIPAPEQKGDGA
jgi:hypothetical protein